MVIGPAMVFAPGFEPLRVSVSVRLVVEEVIAPPKFSVLLGSPLLLANV